MILLPFYVAMCDKCVFLQCNFSLQPYLNFALLHLHLANILFSFILGEYSHFYLPCMHKKRSKTNGALLLWWCMSFISRFQNLLLLRSRADSNLFCFLPSILAFSCNCSSLNYIFQRSYSFLFQVRLPFVLLVCQWLLY